eukprot:2675984-Prymnesium_polylepis.1
MSNVSAARACPVRSRAARAPAWRPAPHTAPVCEALLCAPAGAASAAATRRGLCASRARRASGFTKA